MRFAVIFTVLGLSLGSLAAEATDAAGASGAVETHDWRDWDDFLDHLHDIRNIQDLQDLLELGIGRWGNNPCERVGGSCDPLGATFCRGTYDVAITGLPCRANLGATPVTGCCWHAPRPLI
ncbi:hypothetical protein BBK36DRAFT_147689 [Trichoderma citrinoviride]|uniref:Hydrophobin n=1 Tax=Trichoderma citrinoviride TaxID=58853 RepID=A0A2T4AZX1_9HYPO|nr:hypothetical protein BBK36DRAFT_147689 [Trichoderma citrinoviride]PTB62610.1 hypothetical protein BBK36DRAFT_147689 [Trichoderma citrinoviride]